MKIKTPMRRCVGCMESKPKKQMVRIVCYEGKVSVDPKGKAKGRGIYICPDPACIHNAKKRKALQRSFNINLSGEEADMLLEEMKSYEKKD